MASRISTPKSLKVAVKTNFLLGSKWDIFLELIWLKDLIFIDVNGIFNRYLWCQGIDIYMTDLTVNNWYLWVDFQLLLWPIHHVWKVNKAEDRLHSRNFKYKVNKRKQVIRLSLTLVTSLFETSKLWACIICLRRLGVPRLG